MLAGAFVTLASEVSPSVSEGPWVSLATPLDGRLTGLFAFWYLFFLGLTVCFPRSVGGVALRPLVGDAGPLLGERDLLGICKAGVGT